MPRNTDDNKNPTTAANKYRDVMYWEGKEKAMNDWQFSSFKQNAMHSGSCS